MGPESNLPACAYRRIVASTAPGEDPHVACGCSGGIPIGMANGGGEDLAGVCGSCTIPSELDPARRTCLYLIPVRIWEEDGLRTGFSCRWFASLKPGYLPAEVWKCCFGCPHWFPRPPQEELVPGIDRWIRKGSSSHSFRLTITGDGPTLHTCGDYSLEVAGSSVAKV
ncbi:MAG: hypothetical protein Kow00128_09380 [Deltaproteobacteria bacterium]